MFTVEILSLISDVRNCAIEGGFVDIASKSAWVNIDSISISLLPAKVVSGEFFSVLLRIVDLKGSELDVNFSCINST